jgi:hypothetical protein
MPRAGGDGLNRTLERRMRPPMVATFPSKPRTNFRRRIVRDSRVLPHFCCKTIAHCDEVHRILWLTVVTISRRSSQFFRQGNDG